MPEGINERYQGEMEFPSLHIVGPISPKWNLREILIPFENGFLIWLDFSNATENRIRWYGNANLEKLIISKIEIHSQQWMWEQLLERFEDFTNLSTEAIGHYVENCVEITWYEWFIAYIFSLESLVIIDSHWYLHWKSSNKWLWFCLIKWLNWINTFEVIGIWRARCLGSRSGRLFQSKYSVSFLLLLLIFLLILFFFFSPSFFFFLFFLLFYIPAFASGLSIHQLDLPVPSFWTRIKRLCKDKLCRMEFCKKKTKKKWNQNENFLCKKSGLPLKPPTVFFVAFTEKTFNWHSFHLNKVFFVVIQEK